MLLKGIVKAVIAVSVIGVGAYAVKKISDDKKKEELHEQGIYEEPVEESIKEGAQRKVAQILGFIATHAEEVEAVSMVIGLVSGVFGVMSAFRDWRKGNDTQDKLDEIDRKLNSIMETYNNNVHATNKNMDNFAEGLKGITSNQSLIYDAVIGKENSL